MNQKPKKLTTAMQIGLTVPTAISLLIPLVQTANAATVTNTTSGNFADTSTWGGKPVPGAADTAQLNVKNSTVTYSGKTTASTTVKSVQIGLLTSGNVLDFTGGTLNVTNSPGNGLIVGTSGTATNGSQLIVESASSSEAINVTGGVSNWKQVTVKSGALNSGQYTNQAGSTTNLVGGTLNVTSTVDQNSSLNIKGGTFSAGVVNQKAGLTSFDSGGTATSKVGTLNITGGTVNVTSGDTVRITKDYVDTTGGTAATGFGTGNSFNAKAHVSGTGAIVAAAAGGGVANQVLKDSGSYPGSITNGASATPTLNLGNVHVAAVDSTGTVTKGFVISNSGTLADSPIFRGAVQTTGSLDTRLSGNGTDPNSATSVAYTTTGIAGGASSSDLNVTFKGDSAGSITGGTIKVVDNFGDSQTLVLQGAAYRYADPSTASPAVISLTNQHVNGIQTKSLTISNNAVSTDSYSEKLDASISPTGGDATATGTISLLAAGATSTSDLAVGVDTSTAGHKTGNATITLVSDGSGTSGLGTTALGTQQVSVTGDVYRFAEANKVSNITIANQHVNGSATQTISLSNVASTDGYSEKLDASISPTSGSATASGTISLLDAGATDTTSLSVGVNASSAGHKTGTATISLVSNGAGTSDLGTTGLPAQVVNVTGDVYRFAEGSVSPTNVVIGAQHVGDNNLQSVTVANTAVADTYSESLDASTSAAGQAIANGSINLLAAGATNSIALSVGVDTSSAGSKSGTATITLVSDGSGTSDLGTTAAGSQDISVSGDVYNYADAAFVKNSGAGGPVTGPIGNTWSFDIGTYQLNSGTQTANLGVANVGGSLGSLTDLLEGGNWSAVGDSALSYTASNFSGIQAGLNYLFQVQLDTSNFGTFNKQIHVAWNGYNNLIGSGYVGDITDIYLNLTGSVTSVDEPGVIWLFGAASASIWLSNRKKRKGLVKK